MGHMSAIFALTSRFFRGCATSTSGTGPAGAKAGAEAGAAPSSREAAAMDGEAATGAGEPAGAAPTSSEVSKLSGLGATAEAGARPLDSRNTGLGAGAKAKAAAKATGGGPSAAALPLISTGALWPRKARASRASERFTLVCRSSTM